MIRRILLALLAGLAAAHADPQLTSWFTANSGKYARIYQSAANETAGTTSTTWTRGSGTQTNPAYADVNEINYSAAWVYVRTTGLASHIMGPWYNDTAKTQNFPNFPSNTASVYRIPRTPAIPTTKTLTGLGATGRMVNGVSMFDSRDAFSYSNTNAADATPGGSFTGDGIWNRDGWFNEGITFDPGLAHQAGNNYHYHAHPIALRYQLGDHVDYNATTNRYTESAAAAQHSPIVAWAADGLPVYGPYGYSNPTSAASGVRRMVSGFTKRDGTNGTTAITVRQALPLWAQRIQGLATLAPAQYGPAVNTTYAIGRYIEDFDYRGDLGQVQTTGATALDFDLNEQNVRFCVTPEFPSGTWAYFTPINSDGTPQFPYTTGRAYYGSPTGGGTTAAVMTADTPLTQHFIGGANKALTINTPAVTGTTVTLTWSAVEGGTYSVDASPNQSAWTSKATGIVSTGISANSTYTALGTSGTEYGRVNRTALATYDTNGQTAATVAQTATTSYAPGAVNSAPTITGIANQSTPQNTATSAIAFTVGDAETAAASLTLSGSSANTTLVPNANITFGGSGASRTVTITPATNQTGSTVITIGVSDGTSTTTTAFTLTVTASAPALSSTGTNPATPTSESGVIVTANVAPPSGRTISSVQLTYSTNVSSTSTVFSETMAAAAVSPWTGTNANNAWTITFTGPPTSPFSQTSAANHTPAGQGNQFGMEINANAPNIANSTLTTTNAINATGTSGYVEFYLSTANLSGTMGWDFQTSTDGATWTTHTSELSGSNHAYALYHYDLASTERVSTLKLRFRFAGSGVGTPQSKVSLDDITVVTSSASTPVTITMYDDGAHGDGAAGDGIYGATIPVQSAGTAVSYTITATDSTTAVTTTGSAAYTVVAPAPVLAVTPSAGLTSSGVLGGSFSPASGTYTLSNTGTGTLSWTAGKIAGWLTLSATSGTLAAGAGTTVTATINTAANSLAVGGYSDTITFTNASNGSGNTTRAVSLAILSGIQNWRQTWYGTTGNTGNAADTADPYHTGIPNLLAYAYLGPSQDPALARLDQLARAQMSGGNFLISFTQPSGVSGVTYGAEWRASLHSENWSAVSDSGSGALHVFSVPVGGNTTIFMRLTVTAP